MWGSTEAPDISIIYSEDSANWHDYLLECFSQIPESDDSSRLVINSVLLESQNLPLKEEDSEALSSSCAQLIILSPAFLDYINRNTNVYEIGKLLHPDKVVAMLCGVEAADVNTLHRSVLATYDSWQNILSVIDQDKDFVIKILRKISEILMAANEQTKRTSKSKSKPHFKVTPRRIKEGSNKVYVLLSNPIQNREKVRVVIECNGGNALQVNEVNTRIRNPYTIQFTVPGSYTNVSTYINIHVYCDDTDLGVQSISCLSKMGELAHLLHTITSSPIEFMCQALGLSPDNPDQLDKYLADSLKKHELAQGRLSILDFSADSATSLKSNEEMPTFLHFAARYGFRELCSLLLESIGATVACQVKNCNGQTPAEVALGAGHNHVANLLADFQTFCEVADIYIQMKQDNDKPDPQPVISEAIAPKEEEEEVDLDTVIPAASFNALSTESVEYVEMTGSKTNINENFEPHKKLLSELENMSKDIDMEAAKSENVGIMETPHKRNRASRAYLSNSQYELIEIIDDYKKKNYSLNEVELLFKSWLQSQKTSSFKVKEDQLKLMRENYEAVQLKVQKGIKQTSKIERCRQLLSTLLGKTNNKLPEKTPNVEISAPIMTKSDASNNKTQEQNASWRLSSTSSSSSTSVDRISCVSHDSGNHSDTNVEDQTVNRREAHCYEKSVKKLSRALLDPFYVEKIGSTNGPRLPQRKHTKSFSKESENSRKKYFPVPGSDHMYYEVSNEPEKRDSFGYVLPDVMADCCAAVSATDKCLAEKPPLPARFRNSATDLRPAPKQKSIFYDDLSPNSPKNTERKFPHDDYIEMNTEEPASSVSWQHDRKISSCSEPALRDLHNERRKLSLGNYEILTNEHYVSMDSNTSHFLQNSEDIEAPSEPPPPPPREKNAPDQKPALPPKCPAIACHTKLPPKPISTWRYPA